MSLSHMLQPKRTTSRNWTADDENICKEIIVKHFNLTKEQVWANPDFRNRFDPGLTENNFYTHHTNTKKSMNIPTSQIGSRLPSKSLLPT